MNTFRAQPVPALNDLAHWQPRLYAWLRHPSPGRPTHAVTKPNTIRGLQKIGDLRTTQPTLWQSLQQVLLDTPERVWWWSDQHFGHHNIIKYAGRPYHSTSDMHAAMEQAAQRIGPDDWVIWGGDVALHQATTEAREWLRRMPGHHVLVAGNHDLDRRTQDLLWGHPEFVGMTDHLSFQLPNGLTPHAERLWVSHYPLWHDWIPEGVVQIHGHVHQNVLGGRRINISVEPLEHRPWNTVELLQGWAPQTPVMPKVW